MSAVDREGDRGATSKDGPSWLRSMKSFPPSLPPTCERNHFRLKDFPGSPRCWRTWTSTLGSRVTKKKQNRRNGTIYTIYNIALSSVPRRQGWDTNLEPPFQAHRLLFHSTSASRVTHKKQNRRNGTIHTIYNMTLLVSCANRGGKLAAKKLNSYIHYSFTMRRLL